ncbi:hypothetical protein V496_10481 [Pseudogymnoascus sp. VKM F-4515 (FW-2607)]|nr:hypothetical protein V496_10481 [Pseudogymnoascus sp. VKM F-4515 (FW-2607)]
MLACKNALAANFACSPVVARFQKGSYYAESTFTDTCTTAARQRLTSIIGMSIPLVAYGLACLTDNGRFCNNVADEAAYVLDPGSNDPVTGVSIAQPTLQREKFRIHSSIYESNTSSCSITGMSLTTTGPPWYTVTTATTAPPTTCAGSAYTIQPGDICHTISKT